MRLWLLIAQAPGISAIFAIFCCAAAGKLYLSFKARTTGPAASPNQVSGRRRSHRIVTAPGSALPNQAGEEKGVILANRGHTKKGGLQASLFRCTRNNQPSSPANCHSHQARIASCTKKPAKRSQTNSGPVLIRCIRLWNTRAPSSTRASGSVIAVCRVAMA